MFFRVISGHHLLLYKKLKTGECLNFPTSRVPVMFHTKEYSHRYRNQEIATVNTKATKVDISDEEAHPYFILQLLLLRKHILSFFIVQSLSPVKPHRQIQQRSANI